MRRQIFIDFETYSDVPIDVSAYKYARHSSTDIVCAAYVSMEGTEVKVWTPDLAPPSWLKEGDLTLYAHNAMFDYYIWHEVAVKKYGWPPLPLECWHDTMAMVARLGYPLSLEDAAKAMGLPVQKQKSGAALLRKICQPFKGERPRLGAHYTHLELDRLIEYCVMDVTVMRELYRQLPMDDISPTERQAWLLTQEMNMNGLPVDIDTANRIKFYVDEYIAARAHELPALTYGQVTAPTQAKRIREWCEGEGVYLPNLQAATVAAALLESNLPDNVRQVLELRESIGMSSTAKYTAMQMREIEGRVHDTLVYHGAHTGRWAGRGIQPQNFPRASVKDPEKVIDAIYSGEPIERVVYTAKALIRPMIMAPEGSQLIVADYSSIENRLIALLSDDKVTLERFKESGYDQYIDMASFLYDVDPSKVTAEQRRVGKVIVLGCGYQMGSTKFKESAASQGVDLSDAEATRAVKAYRSRFRAVAETWYGMHEAAMRAIRTPGMCIKYKRIEYQCVYDRWKRLWLMLFLGPSRRYIYYREPSIDEANQIRFMGLNPYTKQWGKLYMSPGITLQNATQALARDVMLQGLVNIKYRMPEIKLLCTVHDEIIGEIRVQDTAEYTLANFVKHMCDVWNLKWLIKAEGYLAKRYRKG